MNEKPLIIKKVEMKSLTWNLILRTSNGWHIARVRDPAIAPENPRSEITVLFRLFTDSSIYIYLISFLSNGFHFQGTTNK
jgi:hypothetical protein